MKLHCALLLFNLVSAIVVIGFFQWAIAAEWKHRKHSQDRLVLSDVNPTSSPVSNATGGTSAWKAKEVTRIEPEFLTGWDAEVARWIREHCNQHFDCRLTSRWGHCEVGLGSEPAEGVCRRAAGWAIGGAEKLSFLHWIYVTASCFSSSPISSKLKLVSNGYQQNFSHMGGGRLLICTCMSQLSGLTGCLVCNRTPCYRSRLFSHPAQRKEFLSH